MTTGYLDRLRRRQRTLIPLVLAVAGLAVVPPAGAATGAARTDCLATAFWWLTSGSTWRTATFRVTYQNVSCANAHAYTTLSDILGVDARTQGTIFKDYTYTSVYGLGPGTISGTANGHEAGGIADMRLPPESWDGMQPWAVKSGTIEWSRPSGNSPSVVVEQHQNPLIDMYNQTIVAWSMSTAS